LKQYPGHTIVQGFDFYSMEWLENFFEAVWNSGVCGGVGKLKGGTVGGIGTCHESSSCFAMYIQQ
jgi:hypothetical protein